MAEQFFKKKNYRDDELEHREKGKKVDIAWLDDDGNKHAITYSGRSSNVATVERMAKAATEVDPAITERKADLEQSADTAITTGDVKKLDTISKTLFGRRAIATALERKGITADDYAEMLAESKRVGMDPLSHDAMASRRHFTTAIEKIGSIDAKKEEPPMQVIVVIGDEFKEISDAIDDRNKGH